MSMVYGPMAEDAFSQSSARESQHLPPRVDNAITRFSDRTEATVNNNISESSSEFGDDSSLQLAEHGDNSSSVIHVFSETVIEFEQIPASLGRPRFAEDLEQSRPYQRIRKVAEAGVGQSTFSVSSSVAKTGRWSMLSELSMADVSDVSVINLPISSQDAHRIIPEGARPSVENHSLQNFGPIVRGGAVSTEHVASKCGACGLPCRTWAPAYQNTVYAIGEIYPCRTKRVQGIDLLI